MAYDFDFEVNGYNFRFVNLDTEKAFGIIVPNDADLTDRKYLSALKKAQKYCYPLDLEMQLREISSHWYHWSGRQYVDRHEAIYKIRLFLNQKLIEVQDWVLDLHIGIINDQPVLENPFLKDKKQQDKSGFVYLIKSERGDYKIGKSKNPEDRLKTFDIRLPFHIEYICTIKSNDMNKLEKELHAKYDHLRIDGEWFKLTSEEVDQIRGLAS